MITSESDRTLPSSDLHLCYEELVWDVFLIDCGVLHLHAKYLFSHILVARLFEEIVKVFCVPSSDLGGQAQAIALNLVLLDVFADLHQ